MSNSKTLQSTLERLNKMTAQNQGGGGGKVKYYKAKNGKNNVLVLATPQTGDPFLEWGEHKALQSPSWKSIPCKKHNKNEECLVCSVIEDLQNQNWKGNFDIWKPIELKIRYFSPIVDLDDLAAGLQWWGYGKSVLGQFENWLINLEEDETPFYDLKDPEKVIITYDKDADPALKYKLDKKSLKKVPTEVDEIIEQIKPLTELFTFDKSSDEVATLLEDYMAKIQDALTAEAGEETSSEGLDELKED